MHGALILMARATPRANRVQELELRLAEYDAALKKSAAEIKTLKATVEKNNINLQLLEVSKVKIAQLEQAFAKSEEDLKSTEANVEKLSKKLNDAKQELLRPTANDEVRMSKLLSIKAEQIEECFSKDIFKLQKQSNDKDKLIDAQRDCIRYFTTAMTQFSVRLTTLVSPEINPLHKDLDSNNETVRKIMEDLFCLFPTPGSPEKEKEAAPSESEILLKSPSSSQASDKVYALIEDMNNIDSKS